jgi:hypothetical protein
MSAGTGIAADLSLVHALRGSYDDRDTSGFRTAGFFVLR